MKHKLFDKDPHFYRNVFTLALPIALQSLVTIGVNMIDTVMVGSLSEDALSATSLANSFITIYHIFCMGLGMGASVLVSRYYGMKSAGDAPDKAENALRQTVCLMLRLTLALALLFALATALLPETIMRTYTSEEHIVALGTTYFRWSVASYFFLGASLTTTIALRSVRQVRLPLLVSFGAFFVNILANYVFIFGKLGAPRMEVAGAAIGTLIARIFEAAIIVGYLLVRDREIEFRFEHMFMKTGSLLGEYIRICIPVLISDGILAVGNNTVSIIIGHVGTKMVAAVAITAVTQQLSSVVVSGVSQSGAIVTGQTLGTGDREKTMRQGYLFFGLGIGLGLISALIILLIKNPVIGSYAGLAEDTRQIAEQLMIALSVIIVFQATNSIMTKGVLRGGGDTKMLMITDNIFLWVVSIPLGLVAAFVLHLDPFWIYVALKSDQIIKTFWSYHRLQTGKWVKKITTGKQTA
ncbi:MAG: MATE family efflux transporter [Lachnospiraceae bacterium]|nr:MATE family efflux transporter [Lachnospiraceae bacterium]